MHVKSRMACKPGLDSRRLVRTVVVHHHVDVQIDRRIGFDGAQKLQKKSLLQRRRCNSPITAPVAMSGAANSMVVPWRRQSCVRRSGIPGTSGMTRVPELLAAGSDVAFGGDCAMDPWYSLGSAGLQGRLRAAASRGSDRGDPSARQAPVRYLPSDQHCAFLRHAVRADAGRRRILPARVAGARLGGVARRQVLA